MRPGSRGRATSPSQALGLLLLEQERPGEAEPLLRQALMARRAALGDAHPDTAALVRKLADAMEASGRLGAALCGGFG